MSARLAARFAQLRQEGRAGLVVYVMACDPDFETSLALLRALPGAGADVIELGFPFTDPMADGPSIQKAGLRALKAGGSLKQALRLAAAFREGDPDTPLILMGYLNPILNAGADAFAVSARQAGADGLILVDLPPEEDGAVKALLAEQGIDLIRLAAPTSSADRLKTIADGASGFLYYVSVTGVTGARAAALSDVEAAMARLRQSTPLPIAFGFGVRTPDQVRAIGAHADAVVVGSAIVDALDQAGPNAALTLVSDLAQALKAARQTKETAA